MKILLTLAGMLLTGAILDKIATTFLHKHKIENTYIFKKYSVGVTFLYCLLMGSIIPISCLVGDLIHDWEVEVSQMKTMLLYVPLGGTALFEVVTVWQTVLLFLKACKEEEERSKYLKKAVLSFVLSAGIAVLIYAESQWAAGI